MPLQTLVDNCNEGTSVSRDLVDRLQLKMHNVPQTNITGVGDVLNLRTSSYATVPAIFDNKHFNISGVVVNSICSNIPMENFSRSPQFKGMTPSIDFEGLASKIFTIDILEGLGILATLVGDAGNCNSSGASPVAAKRIGNALCIKISKQKYLPFGTSPIRSPPDPPPPCSSKSVNNRTMLTLGGPSNAVASTLDVILEVFFKAEKGENGEPSLEQEINKDYTENLLKTYELIPGDPGERGSKRFRIEPLWKSPQMMPSYDSEQGTKEALRRFLALERKINLAKNSKLKDGYHSSMAKHIASGMMEEYGKFDDLKEDFLNAVFDPAKKDESLALTPTRLVVQPSKDDAENVLVSWKKMVIVKRVIAKISFVHASIAQV